MKKALKITASVPVHTLQRYIAEHLQSSEWVVTLAYTKVWLGQERMEFESMLTITPDAFKQHNHG